MIIKIKDTWYDDTKDGPIMLVLDDTDKTCLANMHPADFRYAIFQDDTLTIEEKRAWMDDGDDSFLRTHAYFTAHYQNIWGKPWSGTIDDLRELTRTYAKQTNFLDAMHAWELSRGTSKKRLTKKRT